MKKIILTSAIIFATVAASFAQTPVTDSKEATLNVNLTDVKTITISGNPKIDVISAADFEAASGSTGKSSTPLPGHLKVISTNGGFKVSVNALNLKQTDASDISVDNIYLKVNTPVNTVASSTNLVGFNAVIDHQLSTTKAQLFTTPEATGGTLGTSFSVDYTLKNVTDIANLKKGTYTTQVVYTIEGY